MVRPSPVPPKRREVALSACSNGWKIDSSRSSGMPTPLSLTDASSIPSAPACTAIFTPPSDVNLIALPSRLSRICRIRSPSVQMVRGSPSSTSHVSAIPFAAALADCSFTQLSTRWRRSTGSGDITVWPASIFEMSRMSLSRRIIVFPLSAISCTCRACSGGRSLRWSSSAKPSTPFIGVRISWLMLARNCDLAVAAFSAWRRARISCASSATRSVTSRAHTMMVRSSYCRSSTRAQSASM